MPPWFSSPEFGLRLSFASIGLTCLGDRSGSRRTVTWREVTKLKGKEGKTRASASGQRGGQQCLLSKPTN